jgi:hypothetical protein
VDLIKLKSVVSEHPDYPGVTSDALRQWLQEDVQQSVRVRTEDIYRLALQSGVDEELEDLIADDTETAEHRKVARRFMRLLSQTVVQELDVGHPETQADFATMIACESMPSFDVAFAQSVAALGTQTIKRHQQQGIGLPLVRQIDKARAI